MRRKHWLLLVGLATACMCPPARSDIIVDHQPHPYGGPASDTLFINDFNQQAWELVADDITLAAPATARQLTFWGFFGSSFSCNIQPPSANETVQVRFYDSRPSDGLPGQVLYQESVLNPSRVDTGRIVLVGCGPHEFKYQVDLSRPFDLQPATTYWLEIVQLGDINSLFRWEESISADQNGIAFERLSLPDWRHTTPPDADQAFQLTSVPEPATVAAPGLILVVARSSKRNRKRGRQGRWAPAMPNSVR